MAIIRPYQPAFIPPPGLIAGHALSHWHNPLPAEIARPWLIRGRDLTGRVRWAGRFRSRSDASAFVRSAYTRELWFDRAMWRLPAPCWHPDYGDLVYQLTPSATNIGGSGNTTGPAVAAAVTGAGVPSGATIIVAIQDQSASTNGTMNDTGGSNTYASITTRTLNNNSSNGFAALWYSANVAALTSGNSISYTKKTSGVHATISAMYATGLSTTPLDSAVTATSFGSTSSPSVTSGTPSVAGELFVALLSWNGTQTYTQDTTHSWATPFNTFNDAGAGGFQGNIAGGNQVNAGTSTITFSPTTSANPSNGNASIVVGFKPSGTTYSDSVTETASAADAPTAIAAFVATITESGTAAESPSALVSFAASRTESATATDSPSAVGTFAASITESGAATDTASALRAQFAAITEAAAALDNPSAQAALIAAVAEAATATDIEDAVLILATRLRNIQPILDQIRGAQPALDSIRTSVAALSQLRSTKPTLDY